MDLTSSLANAPLPPAPRSHSQGLKSQQTALVQQLAALGTTLGVAVPTRLLPGDLPNIDIAPEKVVDACAYLRDQLGFDLLSCISGVDMMDHLEVVYHIRSQSNNWIIQMKVTLPPGTNEIDSVMVVWADSQLARARDL